MNHISTYYVCPFCGEYSGSMKLSKKKHIITKQEIKSDPHIIDLGIGQEILLCPCGKQLTWFELEERIDKSQMIDNSKRNLSILFKSLILLFKNLFKPKPCKDNGNICLWHKDIDNSICTIKPKIKDL